MFTVPSNRDTRKIAFSVKNSFDFLKQLGKICECYFNLEEEERERIFEEWKKRKKGDGGEKLVLLEEFFKNT